VLDVNLRQSFCVVDSAAIKRKRGAIVNIASIAVFHVTVPHVPYAASKAEVVALTRDLAHEVGALASASTLLRQGLSKRRWAKWSAPSRDKQWPEASFWTGWVSLKRSAKR
jgi:NAD(P)-dependent dehydrogenase (short-subunit alcohol dehydrogenase family)